MKKKFLAMALSLSLAMSVSACGGNNNSNGAADGGNSSGKPTEIEFWHYFDADSDKELIIDWIEEYNSIQDDIHITPTYMSRDELMNQYTIGAVSGELPDIGMVDSPDMASYISLGVFEDITNQLNSWGELDNFYE